MKRIKFKTYKIILYKKEIKLLIPEILINEIYIDGEERMCFSNTEGLMLLGYCAAYMCKHKDCIIYLPIKNEKVIKVHEQRYNPESNYRKIALVDYKLHLSLKDWKKIIESLRYSKAQIETYEMPYTVEYFKDITMELMQKSCYQEFKEFIDYEDRFDTCFMTGSNTTFAALAGTLFELAEDEEGNKEEVKNHSFPHVHIEWLIKNKDFIFFYYEDEC